jgi:transcriptional regulator with XRE-family HTH domain
VARQRALGLSHQELVDRSGVSAATLRKLRSGTSAGFRPRTLARVSEALDWPPDALLDVLDGQTPPADSRARKLAHRATRLVTLTARLAPHELRAVERLVEELLKGPRPPGRRALS